MKFYTLILFELFFTLISYGQNKLNEFTILDSLNSNQKITEYVLRREPRYSTFELIDTIKKYEKKSDLIIAQRKIKPLYRIDMDNDGAIELIIIQRVFSIDYLYKDPNSKKILHKFLPKVRMNEFVIPYIKNKRVLLDYYYLTYKSIENQVEYKKTLHKSTLILKDSNFIELNKKVRSIKINEIELQTTYCYGECPVFKMTIKSNGQVLLFPKDYTPVKINSESKINSEKLDSIFSLISYINLPHLKERYDVGATDHPTGILKINYNNNKVKNISDYGLQGTFGLYLLFNELESLLYECEWKEIK